MDLLMWSNWHLLGLNSVSEVLSQISYMSKSALSILLSLFFLGVRCRPQSLTWDLMSYGTSFMNSKKRSGPRTEPCDTPELTGVSSEDSPSSTTARVRPTKNDFIYCSILSLVP